MKKNEMEVIILEDGTVRVDTGEVGGPEHIAAEKMLAWLARELGGDSARFGQRALHEHVWAGLRHARH